MQTLERPNVTLAAATTYFDGRLYADAWTNAEPSDREKALTQASFLVAGAFSFSANAYAVDAYGVTTWHERVIAAVCEEALWLLKRDPTNYPELLTLGLAEGSVASLCAKFDRRFLAPLICDAAKNLVGELGSLLEDGSCRSTPLAL